MSFRPCSEGQPARPFAAQHSPLALPRLPRLLPLVVSTFLALALGGCGSGSSTTAPPANHDPATLSLAPDSAEVSLGGQIAFSATVKDSGGAVLHVVVHWTVTDTAIAEVDSTGRAASKKVGRVFIEARTPTLLRRAALRVVGGTPAPVRVEVFPASATLLSGDEQPWIATPRDAAGFFVADRVTWASSNTAVATVDTSGGVHAVAAGSARVTATARGITGESQVTVLNGPTVSNFAGTGLAGSDDGNAAAATFEMLGGIALDSTGALYVAEFGANRVRIVENGQVRILAGGERGIHDGKGLAAEFDRPVGVAVGPGRMLYVAERGNNLVRRIAPDGTVITVAGQGGVGYKDGDTSTAAFNEPVGIAVDHSGTIYVGDIGNHVVRKIVGGAVSTFAGQAGDAGRADGILGTLEEPVGLTLGPNGLLYIADRGNNSSTIRRASPIGELSTLGGNGFPGFVNGPRERTQFLHPYGVVVAPDGWIYVADAESRRVRALSPDGHASTIAGSDSSGSDDGPAARSRWGFPLGIALAANGDLLVSDVGAYRIRRISGVLHLSSPIWPNWQASVLMERPRMNVPASRSVDPLAVPRADREHAHALIVAMRSGRAR